jgi:hypothetical protein
MQMDYLNIAKLISSSNKGIDQRLRRGSNTVDENAVAGSHGL